MPNPQLRILIVDDEDADREDLAEWLTRREKMTVSTAVSAKEGLQLLHDADGRFDAVILDQVLPDIDGIEVTRQIRAEYPGIFIVILTGKGLSAGLAALRAGAYRYIQKPGDNEEIAFLLKHIGDIRQMEQRLLDEERLVKATRSIAEHAISSSRSDLLNHIAQGTSRLLDVPICIIWELDLTDERFKVAAHFGPVDAEYRQSVFIDSRVEAFRKFLQAREPLVLTDIQSANAYLHKKEAAKRGWRSLMSVPLATQERVFAILDVVSCEPREFAPWEKQSLATFAAQAGLAIRQTGLLQHFREIGRLALSRDFRALADYLVDAVSDLTGTAASLWMIEKADDGNAVLRVKASHGLRQEYVNTASLSLDPTLSIVSAGIAQKRPVSRPDIFDDETPLPFWYKEEAALRGWRSFLSVPLLGPAGRPLGALSVYGSSVREFSKDEQELLTAFANQAAIALEDLLQRQRLAGLATLGEVISGRTISGMKSVLEQAAATACTLMGADYTAIYAYDPDRELFYDLDNVVIYPPELSLVPQVKPRERGLAAEVRQLGELIVTDTKAGGSGVVGFADLGAKGIDPQDLLSLIRLAHFIERYEIGAFIGLSLRASLSETPSGRASEEVGVLYINYRAPREFTDEELNLFRVFGQQVANAIHTARLIEKERRLNKQANALRDVAEAIASPYLKPKQVAEKILDELQEVIAYKTATLQLIQRDGDTRELIAARGFNKEKATPFEPHLLRPLSRDNLIREVVARKAPYILPDTHKWEGWGYNPNTSHVRSWACVPLIHGEKVVGLLTLDHDTPEFYQPAIMSTLASFGSQAAVAIRNQQLWGELQRRVNGHKALNQVGMALVGAQNEENILETAVSAAVETLGCVHCSGFCVRGNEIVVVASQGNRASDFPEGRTFELGAGVPGWVAREGKSVLVPDTRKDQRFSSGWSHPDPLALAVVPILLDGRVYGVISAEDDRVAALDQYDLRLLETLASQVSQALRIYRRTADLLCLNHVSEQIRSPQNRQQIFEVVVREAQRNLEAECCNLYTLNEKGILESAAASPSNDDHIGALNLAAEHKLAEQVLKTERSETAQLHDAHALLVPLYVGGSASGVLSAVLSHSSVFDTYSQNFLEMLSSLAGNAIHQVDQRQRRVEALKSRFNPYVVGRAIRDPQGFFGRDISVQMLMDGIRSNNDYIVFGERRIGKTSLLLQLAHHLQSESQGSTSCQRIPVFLTLEGVAERDFFRHIARAIAHQTGYAGDNLHLVRGTSPYGRWELEEDLTEMLEMLEQQSTGCVVHLVLLMDEMDEFVDYSPATHSQFRSLFSADVGKSITMIVAGVSVARIARARTSPWYNLFQELKLSEFDEQAARQLISEPVRGIYNYDPQALEIILQMTGLKPQEMQQLCFWSVEAMLDRVTHEGSHLESEPVLEGVITITPHDVWRGIQSTLRERDGEYRHLWETLSFEQKELVRNALAMDGTIGRTSDLAEYDSLSKSAGELPPITRIINGQVRLTELFARWLKEREL